ncbi:hypothetical protein WMW72_33960 [Paenibacillus filicis]|uniref:Uncharacterized protein n=1 Tax=Paenibacillus filicis TaxID=669464 RepID=A0ABU9DW21_9BACL
MHKYVQVTNGRVVNIGYHSEPVDEEATGLINVDLGEDVQGGDLYENGAFTRPPTPQTPPHPTYQELIAKIEELQTSQEAMMLALADLYERGVV